MRKTLTTGISTAAVLIAVTSRPAFGHGVNETVKPDVLPSTFPPFRGPTSEPSDPIVPFAPPLVPESELGLGAVMQLALAGPAPHRSSRSPWPPPLEGAATTPVVREGIVAIPGPGATPLFALCVLGHRRRRPTNEA